MLLDEICKRDDKGRQRAFHVGGAAAVQHAVAYGRHEGIAVPLLDRAGRHHVGMAGEAHQRARRAAARPQVVDAAHADFFADEAERLEHSDQQVEAAGVFGRDRRAGDQLFGEFQGIDGHDLHAFLNERASHLSKSARGHRAWPP